MTRRFLVPEVVQTSGMDCGPAALTCLLAGFGISASYGRLREACQTDVDGTSINTIEDTARLLGLEVTQVMVAPERVVLRLPALVVVQQPGGTLHFVVVWRRHGRLLQIMDPAVGRRWVRADRFSGDVYVHSHRLPDGAVVRGAVLVRVHGAGAVDVETLPAELRAALAEPPARPLVSMVRPVPWGVLAVAAVAAAIGVTFEAALFREVINGGFGPLLGLAAGLLVLETALASGAARLGRGLDLGLRRTLLARLPLLPDRYLRSRPTSDLAERAHRLHQLRDLPALGAEVVRTLTEIAAVVVAVAWIDPGAALPAALAAMIAIAAALAAHPVLAERDLRQRSHSGALARFFLDGMLGLVPLRAHTAEAVVTAEHDRRLLDWTASGRALARAVVFGEAAQRICGVAAAAWLVWEVRGHEPATFLLLVFWAVSLPTLGARLGRLTRQWPWHRNVALRLLEPLAAPREQAPTAAATAAGGVSIALRQVRVRAGGHTVVDGVDLEVAAGERIAVVGASGSGKSSLIGLLLGWHVPASGTAFVDGAPLDPVALRQHTAWVDPAVRLWNGSLADNLRYGNTTRDDTRALVDAELTTLRATRLGDAGGLLSGGEGQRVRLGRALLRSNVRLALLDEPFRGVDQARRERLLGRLDSWWPGATLLMVTHDAHEALRFSRVLVMDQGRIVEDGPPDLVAESPVFRRLLEKQAEAGGILERWRRIRVENGCVR
ncbi:ATP-binding cassette, subfamily B [Amycolatopsis xylanica]|uniref:ATP-binding cassette, subfamily B n=1 Tax=Amycolatopsis xylanica TaxID=589385 RepID=A0A1H2U6W7_9PSEU|nr:cysteine peptidase family C39 domain-containing protein [Amycolatopsis xylanica]SDW51906.1 ATP-binding cassette, subfamily B [Amycolatopsis xylanica]